ncbi:hypothetical protein WN944_003348 [Citrus x changshan-huyou]|uniref:Uncharacterized protein n=1 Tax=Citrus x changshan-huyou TaxID=2935761 RepID=A0AAP0LYF3_9ROSI
MCAIVKLNGVEVRAMIDTGAMATLVKANLVPRVGLQVARANIAVYLISHHRVIPIGIAVVNLSVGSWVLETTFVVMAMSRFDVILGMEFLYNAEVGTITLDYSNGLNQGNSVIMSIVEEKDEAEEGLDGYTKASRQANG